MNYRSYFAVAFISVLSWLCFSCRSDNLLTTSRWLMGTWVHIKVHDEPLRAEEGIRSAVAAMRRIDAQMSNYRENSVVSAINENAGKHPIHICSETMEVIQISLMISELSDGAFDISIGCLTSPKTSSENDKEDISSSIKDKLALIGWRRILLDPKAQTVYLPLPHMAIDLGGIAKGYAVAKAAAALNLAGCHSFLIDAGGDILVQGKNGKRPWTLGVQHPRQNDRLLAKLELTDSCIFTSGDYYRYYIKDGVRHHHIVDPQTGESAARCQSVTVVGPDPTFADGLSTAVFEMGPERGVALINDLPAYQVLIVDNAGRVYKTAGFPPLIEFNP